MEFEIKFRWPVKQVESHMVVVLLPLDDGPGVMNPEFARFHDLSVPAAEKASEAALKTLLIIE